MMTPARALGFALFLSLSGNLFFTGQYIAQKRAAPEAAAPEEKADCARHGRFGDKGRGMGIYKQLSDADREILREAMGRNSSQFDALRTRMKAQRAAVREAMQSDNPGDLDKVLAESAKTRGEFLRLMRAARQEAESRFSPEGRAIVEKARAAPRDWSRRATHGGMFGGGHHDAPEGGQEAGQEGGQERE